MQAHNFGNNNCKFQTKGPHMVLNKHEESKTTRCTNRKRLVSKYIFLMGRKLGRS